MSVVEINEEMMQEIQELTGVDMKDVDTFTDLVQEHGLYGAVGAWALLKGFAPVEVEKGCGLAMACMCLTQTRMGAAIIEAGMSLGAQHNEMQAIIRGVGRNGLNGLRP